MFEELVNELVVQDPITVLGEFCRMPDGIVRIQSNEPTKQQVEVELLNQQPLRANAVDRLQQQG